MRVPRTVVLLAVGATVLTGSLAGCSDSATEGPSATMPSGETVLGGSLSSQNTHGYLPKQIGQQVGVDDNDLGTLMTLTVTAIAPDTACAATPTVGRFLTVSLDVTLTPSWAQTGYGLLDLTAADFRAFSADGSRTDDVSGAAAACAGADLLPQVAAGQHVVGTVVLDVPATTTSVALVPHQFGGSSGWEWPVPAF